MSVFEGMRSSSSPTLAQRLAEGRIPVGEALRYGMMLAESLRKLHDAGTVHGAVAPGNIALTASGVELLPVLRLSEVTPYTAPEILSRRPAEIASDVFSFGAVLYEMFAGRRAFEGITSGAIALAIQSSQPAPLGSPAVDRLIASCLVKDPAARTTRMQKILMELKLYSVHVRKAEAAAVPERWSRSCSTRKRGWLPGWRLTRRR
jgi:eukaryotic-like serine/threonine-protein kinase